MVDNKAGRQPFEHTFGMHSIGKHFVHFPVMLMKLFTAGNWSLGEGFFLSLKGISVKISDILCPSNCHPCKTLTEAHRNPYENAFVQGKYIVTCQAHPALVKRVQWTVRIFQLTD